MSQSLFEHIRPALTSDEMFLEFMEGLGEYLHDAEAEANQHRPESSADLAFAARVMATNCSAIQEQNCILFDIAESLRVLSGRNKEN